MGISELALAVLLVLVTVSRMGLVGLAGSLLAANVLITFVWIVPYVCRLLGQNVAGFLGASLVRPLLAAVPMAFAILWLNDVLIPDTLWRIVLNSGLAGVVYLAAFLFLSLTSQERALFFGSLRGILSKESR
jgi:hypothetical protein